MFTDTKFWRCNCTDPKEVVSNTYTPVGRWVANYLVDIRRKRTTDDSTAYINQGGCLLPFGKYLLCMISANEKKRELVVVDTVGYTQVSTLDVTDVDLGHANDAIYYDGKVYICTSGASTSGVAVFNYNSVNSTLEYVKTVSLDGDYAAICVDYSNGQFYTRKGTTLKKLNIFNGKTEDIAEFKRFVPSQAWYNNIVADYSLTGQGMAFYDGCFYICYSFPNAIYKVDLKGNVLDVINLPQAVQGHPVGELESCSVDWETGIFYINTYGRSVDDLYEGGEDDGLSWGFTHVFNIGKSIDNYTIEFRNGGNTGTSNTVGSRRTVYGVAREEDTIIRHTGTRDYPFTSIQSIFYFMKYTNANSSRTAPFTVRLSGDFNAYSKWASIYTTCQIELDNATLGELHVGEGTSIKITGTGEVDKVVLLFGSIADLRVDVNNVSCSSGNIIYLLEDNVFPNVSLNGSIVRVDNQAIVNGTMTGCMVFGTDHQSMQDATELLGVDITESPMYYGRCTKPNPTE